jgi:thiol-disulfide isomerase/thioredoxin
MQNRSQATLRRLYLARHGSMEGYEAYVDQLAAADRDRRRDIIAREFKQDRVPLPAFRLTALDGRIVSSDSLVGHPLVINAWGTWCGACVAEMGDIQKFAARYASDSVVRVVTIDNDRDVDELRAWLKQRGYDFPVLIDDGYVAQHVRIWPTTFFVDRHGRIASVKTGWSEALVEEFGWRIEILRREGKTTP